MNQFSKLQEWRLIGLQGPESGQFAQSQLTSNVEHLSTATEQVKNGTAQMTAYCEPKGRVIANGYLFRPAMDYYLLAFHHSLVESVTARLKMYVLRSKVQVDISSDYTVIDWHPGEGDERIEPPSVMSAFCPMVPGCHRLVGLSTEAGCAQAQSSEGWRQDAQNNGLAIVESRTTEMFTPQMLNLDQLGAVSFDKGCYPGQEIVARTHYLGKVKRQLRSVQGQGEAPAPGSTVMTGTGASAGTIVSSVAAVSGTWLGLAVIRDGALAGEALTVGDPASPLSHIRSLRKAS